MHTPVYGVKEFFCLSVCLYAVNFEPNYLRTGWTEWAKKLNFHLTSTKNQSKNRKKEESYSHNCSLDRIANILNSIQRVFVFF